MNSDFMPGKLRDYFRIARHSDAIAKVESKRHLRQVLRSLQIEGVNLLRADVAQQQW